MSAKKFRVAVFLEEEITQEIFDEFYAPELLKLCQKGDNLFFITYQVFVVNFFYKHLNSGPYNRLALLKCGWEDPENLQNLDHFKDCDISVEKWFQTRQQIYDVMTERTDKIVTCINPKIIGGGQPFKLLVQKYFNEPRFRRMVQSYGWNANDGANKIQALLIKHTHQFHDE